MAARRYIRLPVYDEEGNELPQFVEYSLPTFQQQVPNSTLVIRSTEEPPKPTVIEWRKIPGFTGYILNQHGDMMLADGPEDLYPEPVRPVSGLSHIRRYNILGDDNRGHERSEGYFLQLAFPELIN